MYKKNCKYKKPKVCGFGFFLLLSFHLVVTEAIKHLLCTALYIFVVYRRY